MAHHAEEKLPVIKADFINRTLTTRTSANLTKGLWYGGLFAISQSFAYNFVDHMTAAQAAKKAINVDQFLKASVGSLTTFLPIIAGHTAAFTVIRDQFEQGTVPGSRVAWLKATAVTAIPYLGLLAMKRGAVAQVPFGREMVLGLASTALLQFYDREYKLSNAQVYGEYMISNRRQF